MSTKKIKLPDVGCVTLIKRAQSRSLRLSVSHTGVRVSMPRWTPFSAGEAFARAHAGWIIAEQAKQSHGLLEVGQRIGKLHSLRFEHILDDRAALSRVTGTEVIVGVASGEHTDDTAVQERARAAAVRALKREAKLLLPPRLAGIATDKQMSYKSIDIKSLKRRWGSCSSEKAITLNLYLMELPWIYIDYVLKHELTHTEHMNHGSEFWELLTKLEPNARSLSRQLRKHQPAVGNWQP